MTVDLSSTASPLAFGTMQFGGGADETASRAMYDACRAAGITHFDTAYVYTDGASERLLGTFAVPERENVYIATKVNYAGGNGRASIHASLDESRKRLSMDIIDLLYLHRFDANVPLEESFETLAALQTEGKIRHIGVSNFAAWQVMRAQAICARLGTRIDAIQPMYNLVKRQAEVELLPMCASEGISAFPYSPLGGGLLTGKYVGGGAGRITENKMYAARYAPDWMHAAAEALAQRAAALGVSPATLAVAWAKATPGVTAPIISAKSTEQLAPSLAALDYQMPPELYADIASLSPAPPPATDRLEEA
ncbi:MAG: aldo/keto reductase [Pseudomonadota bacterium]